MILPLGLRDPLASPSGDKCKVAQSINWIETQYAH